MPNRPTLSEVSSPTVRVCPDSSPLARAFGWKESSAAAASTRSRVAARTSWRPLSALEAVAIDTPASEATSLMVARLTAIRRNPFR